jgi:hypothetical protein
MAREGRTAVKWHAGVETQIARLKGRRNRRANLFSRRTRGDNCRTCDHSIRGDLSTPSASSWSRTIRAQTRNKFALDPAAETADYELRVGDLRALYRVEQVKVEPRVIVAIIGKKDGNKLIVEGEEFPL